MRRNRWRDRAGFTLFLGGLVCPAAQASSLGLDTVGYFHSSSEASQNFQNALSPQLIGKWNDQSQSEVLTTRFQADLKLQSSATYFEIPEAYVGTSANLSFVQFGLGRRLEHWNRLDEVWEMGLWQPRFRWDYLHPEIVGLSGGYLTVERPWGRLVLFGSPLFIPERGVPVAVHDGSLDANSRWFIPPPASVSVFGKDTPLHYRIQIPELRDLLLNSGTSAMLRVGAAERGPWGSIGYAYKPMNQLVVASDGYLSGLDGPQVYADASIYPRIQYHQLASVETGYSSEEFSAWVSGLGEKPQRDETPASWTTQETAPALGIASNVDIRVAGKAEGATRIELNYLRTWGGNAGDEGPQASGGDASNFESRYLLRSALALGVKAPLPWSLAAHSRVLYDFGHEGGIWSTEVQYRNQGPWLFGVGADLMASEQKQDLDNTDLLGRYRANDRVHAGVTYVF